jgi:hypothetical protein
VKTSGPKSREETPKEGSDNAEALPHRNNMQSRRTKCKRHSANIVCAGRMEPFLNCNLSLSDKSRCNNMLQTIYRPIRDNFARFE